MGAQLAPATTMTKQKLSFATINVKEAGYVFVYLSYDNSSNNWVYFDDFKITHTPTNVIQYNEYYPFGLQTSNSWTREGNVNDYLYNAGSELNGNSGWYETFFRGYDPVLGRFMQVDPMSSALPSVSPYNFGLNDPVYYNDPMGDYVQARIPPMYVGRTLQEIFGAAGGGGFYGSLSGGSLSDWINKYRPPMYMTPGAFMKRALKSRYGGSWRGGQAHFFRSDEEAFQAGSAYLDKHEGWKGTVGGSKAAAWGKFYGTSIHDRYRFRWSSKAGLKRVKYLGLNDDYREPWLDEPAVWMPLEPQTEDDLGLRLLTATTFVKDGHFKTESGDFKFLGGQHIRIELTNMNVLGVQINLEDQSLYYIEKSWLGSERKVYSGDSYSTLLLPGQTKSFDFYRFDYAPMLWQFGLDSEVSDAVNVRVRIYSTWIPGDLIDPKHPNYNQLAPK